MAVTANGYGKRTRLDAYRITRRGGKGIITVRATEAVSAVLAARIATATGEVVLQSAPGAQGWSL